MAGERVPAAPLGPKFALALLICPGLCACPELSGEINLGGLYKDAGTVVIPTQPMDGGSTIDAGFSLDGGGGIMQPIPQDLTVERLQDPPYSTIPGEVIPMEVLVRNQSSTTSPDSSLRLWLTPTSTRANYPEMELIGHVVGGLGPGHRRDFSFGLKMPEPILPGRYRVTAKIDPDDNIDERDENNNSLSSRPFDLSYLRLDPGRIDFGQVHPGCTATTSITLTNLGPTHASLWQATLGDLPGAFDMRRPDLPMTLAYNQRVTLELSFTPSRSGLFAGDLVLGHDQYIGPQRIAVRGEGRKHPVREERFTQVDGPILDILFIIDTICERPGCPLRLEQMLLADRFRTLQVRLGAQKANYHIAVTTTDVSKTGAQGAFRGPAPIISRSTFDAPAAFRSAVQAGDLGRRPEEGLSASLAALTPPLSDGANAGFLRPESGLLIHVLTVGDDLSASTAVDYLRQLSAMKRPADVSINTMGGKPPLGCTGISPAHRYDEIVHATGGVFDDLCGEDSYESLTHNPRQGFGMPHLFPLSGRPIDEGTIEVYLNGRRVWNYDQVSGETHWIYDPRRNRIDFQPGFEPQANAEIVINYRSDC